MTAKSLRLLAGIEGLGAVIRDDKLLVRWCDDAYAALCEVPMDRINGTSLHDILPAPAAAERAEILREAVDSAQPVTLVQFGNDKRLVSRVMPIDPESFGYRGVLCLIAECPLDGRRDCCDGPTRLLQTPYLAELAQLTKAELRTLYDIACGRSNQDTADRQYRSVRTIENHVESIHKKLGTATRSALVRFATERGMHGFTPEEWDLIVEGSAATRRAAAPEARVARDPASDRDRDPPRTPVRGPASLN